MAVNKSSMTTFWQKTVKMTGHIYNWFLSKAWRVTRDRLAPVVRRSPGVIKNEALKIHSQQNWKHRAGNTFTSTAAGVGTAIFSTKIVENFVETRELSNLWGLFASRPIVSETTFEILSFLVEFIIALTVFTITEYYFSEYLRKRKAGQQTEVVAEDSS